MSLVKPRLSTELLNALSDYQNEQDNLIRGGAGSAELAAFAAKYMNMYPEFEFVDGPCTPKSHFEMFSKNFKADKPTWGGARIGAGRKAKEKTKVVRVPESLVPYVEMMTKPNQKNFSLAIFEAFFVSKGFELWRDGVKDDRPAQVRDDMIYCLYKNDVVFGCVDVQPGFNQLGETLFAYLNTSGLLNDFYGWLRENYVPSVSFVRR